MAGLRPLAGGTGGTVSRPAAPSSAGTRPPIFAQVAGNQFAPMQAPSFPPQPAAAP
jgi:hypothetical protein